MPQTLDLYDLIDWQSQEQIDKTYDQFEAEHAALSAQNPNLTQKDSLKLFYKATQANGAPWKATPDSLLGDVAKGFSTGATGLVKAAASGMEAVGGLVGSQELQDRGRGGRELWTEIQNDPKILGMSPQAQAYAQAKDSLFTTDQVARGLGQGGESIAEMLAFGGASKIASGSAAIGKAAAAGIAGYQGGGATLGELNETSPQTPGLNLLAGAASAAVNGTLDTLLLNRIPGWGNVSPRIRGKGLSSFAGWIKQAASGAGVEMGTEAVQSILDSAIKYGVAQDKALPEGWQGAFKQAVFEGAIGGMIGGGVAGVANVGNSGYEPGELGPNPTPDIANRLPAPNMTTDTPQQVQYDADLATARQGLATVMKTRRDYLALPVGWGQTQEAPLDMEDTATRTAFLDSFTGGDPALDMENSATRKSFLDSFIGEDPAPKGPPIGWGQPDMEDPAIRRSFLDSFTGGEPEMNDAARKAWIESFTGGEPVVAQQTALPETQTPESIISERQPELADLLKDSLTSNEFHAIGLPYRKRGVAINLQILSLQDKLKSANDEEEIPINRRIKTLERKKRKIEQEGNAALEEARLKKIQGIPAVASATVTPEAVEITVKSGKKAKFTRTQINPNVEVRTAPTGENIVVQKGTQTQAPAGTANNQQDLSGIHGMEQEGGELTFADTDGKEVKVNARSLITLVDPKEDTLPHELFHAWKRFLLTDPQLKTLDRAYGTDEETQANAYGKFAVGQGKGHPLFRFLRDTARSFYQMMTGQNDVRQAEKVFKSVYNEEVSDSLMKGSTNETVNYQKKKGAPLVVEDVVQESDVAGLSRLDLLDLGISYEVLEGPQTRKESITDHPGKDKRYYNIFEIAEEVGIIPYEDADPGNIAHFQSLPKWKQDAFRAQYEAVEAKTSKNKKVNYQKKAIDRRFDAVDALRMASPSRIEQLKAAFREARKNIGRQAISKSWHLRGYEERQAGAELRLKGPMSKTEAIVDLIWGGDVRRANEIRKANVAQSMVAQMEMMPGKIAALSSSAMAGTRGVTNLKGEVDPSVQSWAQIKKGWKKSDLNDFSRYITALSSIDRHAARKGPKNYSEDQALQDVVDLDQLHPDFYEKEKEFQKLSAATLHWLVEAGQIGEAEFKLLRAQNPHYAPFWAVSDLVGTMKMKGAVREMAIPIQKAFGGVEGIHDPLDSSLRNMRKYAAIAERHRVTMQAIEQLSDPNRPVVSKEGNIDIPIRKLSSKDKAFRDILKTFQVDSDDLIKILTDVGAIEITGEVEGGPEAANAPARLAKIMLAAGSILSNPTDNTFIIPTWKNGVFTYDVYQAENRQLFNTFTDYDIDNSAMLQGLKKIAPFLAPFARLNRAAVTATLEFGFGNVFRDVPQHSLLAPMRANASVMEHIKTRFPGRVHLRGILTILKNEKTYQMLVDSGITQSNLMQAALDNGAEATARELRQAQDGVLLDSLRHPVEALSLVAGWVAKPFEKLSNFSETAGRLGVYDRIYKEAIADGKSEKDAQAEAGWAAVNTTQNFSRQGSVVQPLNQIASFFGAGVGGWYRMYEAARTNPVSMGVFAGVLASGSVGLMMFNRRDPRWKDIPEYEKDMYWFVLFPGKPIVRIPKPFEAGTFFGSVPERIAEMKLEEDPLWKDKVFQAFTAFNIPSPMPTFLSPLYQNMVNRDWKGSPVVSRREEFLAPAEQFSPYTSDTAKMLASVVRGVSPEFIERSLEKVRLTSPKGIDNLLKAYGAGIGRYATDVLTDPAIRVAKGEPLVKSGPAWSAADYPVARRFISRESSTSAQPIKDFNVNFDKVEEAHNTLVSLRKRGDTKRYQEYAAEHRTELMAYKRMNDASQTLGDLNRLYKQAQENPNMTREARRTRMDYLASRMARLAETANRNYARITSNLQ